MATKKQRVNNADLPWGLTRMRPFPAVAVVSVRAVGLDPLTQTAIYEDAAGHRLEMGKHSATHRCVETKTQTSRGDGSGPSNVDQGHDQRTEQDTAEE
ncbi:putative ATP-grasp-modified RiPP [Streptomyces qinzhouensis]|uniref:Putative ATP-grasp-modified RiPP n=1 Tax=Streptomyces qinzhouensis TaxID=2599401 RepID=A0A5B8JAN0_9ACTN|nr:putative ATP-grasp-modified RiPP [Streptomyces qinzhouensis]QDY77494.1 putative ATP-grasp-modified RiPP [Streptomyces qinzhouensis]